MKIKDIHTLTIVPCDNVAHINGKTYTIEGSIFPTNIHAIQWTAQYTHIEYNDDTPQETITDFSKIKKPLTTLLKSITP